MRGDVGSDLPQRVLAVHELDFDGHHNGFWEETWMVFLLVSIAQGRNYISCMALVIYLFIYFSYLKVPSHAKVYPASLPFDTSTCLFYKVSAKKMTPHCFHLLKKKY